MARARNIKPGLYANEDLAECSIWARYVFPGLWMLADREGRLEDRPKKIKAALLPFDSQEMEPLLEELRARKFILRYTIDGLRYIQITRFKEHQSPHYSEKVSVIKPPPLSDIEAHLDSSHQDKPEKKVRIKRGSQPPDSLIPDSLIADCLIPDSGLLIADPLQNPSGATSSQPAESGVETWAAYANAYLDRYANMPVRNAKTNAHMLQLVKRVGALQAPLVAAWYLRSERATYVQSRHSTDLLVRDCEGLHTDMLRGESPTEAQARQGDRTATTANVFAPLIAEARAALDKPAG